MGAFLPLCFLKCAYPGKKMSGYQINKTCNDEKRTHCVDVATLWSHIFFCTGSDGRPGADVEYRESKNRPEPNGEGKLSFIGLDQ